MKKLIVLFIGVSIILIMSAFFYSCALHQPEPVTQKQLVQGNEYTSHTRPVRPIYVGKCSPGSEAERIPAINKNPGFN